MVVFTLPSFPYVFKIIKDKRSKEVSREFIQSQYQLVKLHDRAGRMADTWEYSGVPFPKDRVDPAAAGRAARSRAVADRGRRRLDRDLRHLYIERRMVPLNIYLEQADDAGARARHRRIRRRHQADGRGQHLPRRHALQELRHDPPGPRRVLRLRRDRLHHRLQLPRIPPPRTPEDEMSAEPWYSVGPHDVFPEEFATFLLGDPRDRASCS